MYNIDKNSGKIFSGISFNSSLVKKDNIFAIKITQMEMII